MKKNKIYLLALTILFTAVLTGCSDDFLDEQPYSDLSQKQREELEKKDPDIVKAGVYGMYSNLFVSGAGTGNADNFAQKAIDLRTDLMSGDVSMVDRAYGWFSGASQLSGYLSTAPSNIGVWSYYYRLIKSANDILDGTNDTIPEKDVKRAIYVSQAKFIRGYAYYNLLQIYAGNYEEWKDKPVIPYYRTQKTVKTEGLSTPSQIMAKTILDLEKALKVLETAKYQRTFKFEINANVAKGILAYCKLYIGDYQGAADLTKGLLDLPLMSKSEVLESGFNSVKIPGWMWAVDVIKSNTGGLNTFWGHIDIFTYSYAWAGMYKAINTNLYAEFTENDVRKKWFDFETLDNDGNSVYQGSNMNKFYDSNRQIGGDRQWVNDICFMRVAEMLLINAEANARLLNDTDAKTALNKLLVARGVPTADKLDNTQLLEEIHKNWRFEMWAEGKSLAVMKRFKATITRGDNDFAGKTIGAVSYNDKRLTFEIPEDEKVNNPKLK